jgi:hypothetical protein
MNNTTSKWPVWTILMFLVGVAGGVGALKYIPALGARLTTPEKSAKVEAVAPDEPAIATHFTAIETSVAAPDPSADHAASQELKTLRDEISALKSLSTPAADHPAASHPNEPTIGSRVQISTPASATGEQTLAYWNGMNAVMEHEAAMRAAPPQINAGNALSFVNGETSAYQYAVDAIRKLNRDAVDPDVISLAREIVAWYRQGITNSQIAQSLLQSSDVASRQGQPGQDWQTAEKQHREQCSQINCHGEQLRESLSRKYGITFPKLQ